MAKQEMGVQEVWNQLRKKGLHGDDDAVRFRHPGECVSDVEVNLKNACLSALEKNNEEKAGIARQESCLPLVITLRV